MNSKQQKGLTNSGRGTASVSFAAARLNTLATSRSLTATSFSGLTRESSDCGLSKKAEEPICRGLRFRRLSAVLNHTRLAISHWNPRIRPRKRRKRKGRYSSIRIAKISRFMTSSAVAGAELRRRSGGILLPGTLRPS